MQNYRNAFGDGLFIKKFKGFTNTNIFNFDFCILHYINAITIPIVAATADITQNLMVTLVSGQPRASK